MISGGTPARGAILFAGAVLIVVDRLRTARVIPVPTDGSSPVPSQPALPASTRPIQSLVRSGPFVLAAGLGSALASLFAAHSWPLTVVVGLVGVLGLGWAWVTLGDSPPVGRLSLSGWLPWATVLSALGVWELSALIGQPTLEAGSYAHPTISYLLDPVLATYPGRLLGILLWLVAGRILVAKA